MWLCILILVTTFKYLGHIISNDLSHEPDMKASEVNVGYAKSNMLRQIFHFCSTAVNKLFSTYFSSIYMCALWVNCRKTMRKQFSVACIMHTEY